VPINYNRLLIVRLVYEDAKYALEKIRALAEWQLVDLGKVEAYNEVRKHLDAARKSINEAAKVIHCDIVEGDDN